ncbi:Peptide methionine sulfoxide reductase msrA [Thalassoporum mexicanum PCC 7367]|uniref:peptide-methionine (S)-S-oxide reductase MsrA n=1 Tax=Thalassoporum mexicanum TaxID=3457544 RepID=UPI00029FD37A|nr:peptide-methionine (S)-S-oxide reductase MsrA [Pseudanabaena sp. PCC 7367]AFY70389.1 Peptide methionine sulfoxide reductase msrA [Pseudanabaena sp. PCC 7367]
MKRSIAFLAAAALGLLLIMMNIGTQPTNSAPPSVSAIAQAEIDNPNLAVATFAGGCFWCMEHPFDEIDGVLETTSGYTGGSVENPSYRQVSSGRTGHAEAVQITYDPKKVSYETLLNTFWRNVDPLDAGGQFCDRGNQYRTGIFAHSPEQKAAAIESKQEIAKQLNKSIVTAITTADEFYPAEDYHQNYYQTHSLQYKYYRYACGRDRRLNALWGQDQEALSQKRIKL